jgi:acyl-CoA synthetase (AMP-forming)/AMP-acid ligase II
MLQRFEPAGVLRVLEKEGITVTNLVPTMLNDLVTLAETRGVPAHSLRLLMSGGAPITPHLVGRIVEIFRCEYVQTYGLTETSPYLTFSLLADHIRMLSEEEQLRYRCKTGRAAKGVELRVLNEQGRDVPADDVTVGEIVARGDRVTPGYWRAPQATAEAFRDGWFHTGDLATIDGEGYLNIVDRKKDVVLTGGETVFSTEVENVLAEHPEVRECAVVGAPDERLGERVHAFVVPRPGSSPGADGLIAFCRQRLAHFKCPRSVTFLSSLPRTGSHKISKRLLREELASG